MNESTNSTQPRGVWRHKVVRETERAGISLKATESPASAVVLTLNKLDASLTGKPESSSLIIAEGCEAGAPRGVVEDPAITYATGLHKFDAELTRLYERVVNFRLGKGR